MGPFVGSILFGYIAMKFGRKTALLYMPIPMIVSMIKWTVEIFLKFIIVETLKWIKDLLSLNESVRWAV